MTFPALALRRSKKKREKKKRKRKKRKEKKKKKKKKKKKSGPRAWCHHLGTKDLLILGRTSARRLNLKLRVPTKHSPISESRSIIFAGRPVNTLLPLTDPFHVTFFNWHLHFRDTRFISFLFFPQWCRTLRTCVWGTFTFITGRAKGTPELIWNLFNLYKKQIDKTTINCTTKLVIHHQKITEQQTFCNREKCVIILQCLHFKYF